MLPVGDGVGVGVKVALSDEAPLALAVIDGLLVTLTEAEPVRV